MSIVEAQRSEVRGRRPGKNGKHAAPLPNTDGHAKIKREDAPEAKPTSWQTCTVCGRQYLADLPGKCAICDGPRTGRFSRAEQLIPLTTCAHDGCEELIGAELEFCAVHRKRGDRAQGTGHGVHGTGHREEAPGLTGGAFLTVPLDSIERDPNQPREEFDPGELAKLAESIKTSGVLQPLLVRPSLAANSKIQYRLVAGERRWRAAGLAELAEVPVRVLEGQSAADVLRIQGEENLLRQDLNPIEEAEWCRRMTAPVAEGGGGLTQAELGRRLGVTQAEISNRIRVLRVPDWARKLVISGQMPRKHALALLEYETSPDVLKALEGKVLDDLKRFGGLATYGVFADEAKRVALRATVAIEGEDYVNTGRGYEYVKWKVEPTEEQRKSLRLIELDGYGRNAPKEWRAGNRKLAAKLIAEAEAAAKQQAAKKSDRHDARQSKERAELTPAERKQKDAQRKAQLTKKTKEWYHDWLRVLCGWALRLGPTGRLANKGGEFDGVGWLALWALLQHAEHPDAGQRRFCELAGARPREGWQPWIHKVLAELPAAQCDAAMRAWTIGLLIDDDGPRRTPSMAIVPDEVVVTLAELLKIDTAAAWRDDRASALRERFFNLHDKDQLLSLAKELGVSLLETQKKSEMVNILIGQQKPLPMPAALKTLAVKGTSKSTRSTKRGN